MDFNDYNQRLDIAIKELIDIKVELSHVKRGFEPPKCNPVIVNPSIGTACDPPVSVDLRADQDSHELEGAFIKWIDAFCTRLTTRPEPTV